MLEIFGARNSGPSDIGVTALTDGPIRKSVTNIVCVCFCLYKSKQ